MIRQRAAVLYTWEKHTVDKADVFLYPTGMSGITNLFDVIRGRGILRHRTAMVAYGFLYVDTFKVLSRIHTSPGILFGHCTVNELDALESKLFTGHLISAVFIEALGNPLLQTTDLYRLRRLADTYDFLVITNDTVSTPFNVRTLHLSDAVCTSLTKMFSGGCNTMGGAVILNAKRKFYDSLRHGLVSNFIDSYYPLDAVIMEQNSRDFTERADRANKNAEMVVSLLHDHPSIKQLYYPSVSRTKAAYDSVRRPNGGYSYLLSVQFRLPAMAVAFFDALDVAKGPSLGTKFTFACPYTLFAHYNVLKWAESYGVPEDLVRFSVGVEDEHVIRQKILVALQATLQIGESPGDTQVQ